MADWPGAAPVAVTEELDSTPGDPWRTILSNVTTPTLQPFLPERGKATGAADGIAAIRVLRQRAGEWGIDPHRVGIMGFSAGGHVAGMAGIAPDKADRPDFVGLI